MAIKLDIDVLAREAVEADVAAHIKARCAQTATVLIKGSAEGQARFFVKRWSSPAVRVYYFLARTADRFYTHAELAEQSGWTAESVREFWRRLRGLKIPCRHANTAERVDVPLYRRKHELFFSNVGVKLQVKASMLRFDHATVITETTRAATAAFHDNYEGATAAQEADATQSEERRAEPRRLLTAALTPADAEKRQASLFGKG